MQSHQRSKKPSKGFVRQIACQKDFGYWIEYITGGSKPDHGCMFLGSECVIAEHLVSRSQISRYFELLRITTRLDFRQ